MTDKEFNYVPRFDWDREIARSRRRIAVRVAARAGLWIIGTLGCDHHRDRLVSSSELVAIMGYTHGTPATRDRDAQIVKMFGEGWTKRRIANELVVPKAHVIYRIWKLKRLSTCQPHYSFWDDPDHVAEFRRLYDMGITTSEIGARMGVSKNTIIGRAYREGKRRKRPAIPSSMDRLAAANVFPEPGICLWGGDGEEIRFDCPEHQHKWLNRLGELVSSAYCKHHHSLTHTEVPSKAWLGAVEKTAKIGIVTFTQIAERGSYVPRERRP